MKILSFALVAAMALSGCAQTILYSPKTGQKLAVFQGDMVKSAYSGGGVKWTVDQVSHSTATLAQGQAASNVIGATGTAVAGAAIAVGASGWLPKLLGAAAPAATTAGAAAAAPKPAALQAK